MEEINRQCWTCKLEFPLELFPKHKAALNGRARHCKICRSKEEKVNKEKRLKRIQKSKPLNILGKYCVYCNVFKLISEFYKNKSSIDRHYRFCIDCHKIKAKVYRSKYKETIRAKAKLMSLTEKPFKASKYCTGCKVEKTTINFRKNAVNIDGFHYLCRQCSREKWLQQTEEQIKRRQGYRKKYAENNIERIKERKNKERTKKSLVLNTLFTSDSYLKKLINQRWNLNHIPQEVIETKRVHLQLRRKIKEISK